MTNPDFCMKNFGRAFLKHTAASRGFTLMELVIVLVIATTVVAWSFPSFMQSIQNNHITAQNSSLVALLHFARTESIRRNQSVTVAFTTGDGGWSLVVEDPNNEVEVEGCVPGQLRCVSYNGAVLTPPEDLEDLELVFNNRGYITQDDPPWRSETFFLQHLSCDGDNQRTRIDISPTGQVSSCTLPCDDESECPL